MRRVLLCSMAVPWPNRPLLGIFHIHQARAVRALGGEMALFSPSVPIPRWLGRLWPRLKDHAGRPERYEIDGVDVFAPRTWFAFPPFVRQRIATTAPRRLLGHADRTLARSLDTTIAAFRPDALLAHGILPWAETVANAGERAGIPHAFIEHSAGDLERIRPGTRLARVSRAAAHRARATLVVGPQMRDHAENVLGWPNVVLLPNGALRAGAPPPPRPAHLAGRRVVLAAANYYRRKGLEELVDAFGRIAERHSDAELHVVTTAPRSLRARIAASRASRRIVLHEAMAPAELLTWMAWADLFALPSWSEAFGLVYVEALAQGTPVVCTTDSGFWRFARRWTATGAPAPGLAAPPQDVDALSGVLDGALQDPADTAASARSGGRMVDAWFSWERNARTLLGAVRGSAATQEVSGWRSRSGDLSTARSEG